eukprot:558179-Pyramimonas_sp.AAC.1
MVRVPHHYLPAGPHSVHGYAPAMLGQCPGYEAIKRLQIIDAVASHRRFGERLQQPLEAGFPAVVGALAHGVGSPVSTVWNDVLLALEA